MGCGLSFGGGIISHQGIGYAVLIGTTNGGGVIQGYYPAGNWEFANHGLGNGLNGLNVKDLNLHVPFGAFAAVDSGVYRTDVLLPDPDWHAKNRGLANAAVTSLTVAKDPSHTVYAGHSGQRRLQECRSWHKLAVDQPGHRPHDL